MSEKILKGNKKQSFEYFRNTPPIVCSSQVNYAVAPAGI